MTKRKGVWGGLTRQVATVRLRSPVVQARPATPGGRYMQPEAGGERSRPW
ncbi:MAG: hypothetical protein IT355_20900 [Gemmatimonadaceae bacterium]|nr:hypothetical protein [Gemmatimonadaceae bacterium]